jgi:hypothetical protein
MAKDIDYFPSLGAAERPSFLNPYPITDLALILFIVGLIPLGANHNFAVLWMGSAVFDGYHNSFIHFVADD